MTKTQALKQATEDVTMYRQGSQWIMSSYDPKARANRVSHAMSYWVAREQVTQARAERVLVLMGHDPYDPVTLAAYEMDQGGNLAERVNRGLATIAA